MMEKKYKCQICGRPISHRGNCLACNYKKKYGKPFTQTFKKKIINEKSFFEKDAYGDRLIINENFIKSLLEKDAYGDRLLLRRIQSGNENFRKYVLGKYGYACFFCKRTNIPFDIHHFSYDLKCKFFKTKYKGKKYTKGQKKYQRRISNCEKCRKYSKEIFDKCMSSVIPICRECHDKLHIMMKKTFGYYVPPQK